MAEENFHLFSLSEMVENKSKDFLRVEVQIDIRFGAKKAGTGNGHDGRACERVGCNAVVVSSIESVVCAERETTDVCRCEIFSVRTFSSLGEKGGGLCSLGP